MSDEQQKEQQPKPKTESAKHGRGSALDAVFAEVAEKKDQDAAKKTAEKPEGKKIKGRKKKAVKHLTVGNIHIQATYNNTIITITDQNGNVIGWSSAGKCGFKGPKKSTPYAAGVIVRDAIEKIKDTGMKDAHVFIKGIGMGREAAVRALNGQGVNVVSIKDITPIPHGGCRPKKPRRV